uniref:dUTP diphosphatase n=1 Tax=viral metagenome TaxID=1070528 RepID=A0A6C0H6S4_9ZZZZ
MYYNHSKTFQLLIDNPDTKQMYLNHSTFHDGDAGLDLFITEDATVAPHSTVLVDLGVQCQSRSFDWCIGHWLKGNFYRYHSYWLVPRSSISKTPLIMQNSIGLIDKGYTGRLKAPFYNTSEQFVRLKRGERYVQLVNADLSSVHFTLVDSLRDTSRGEGGFGSTGR